MQDCQKKQKEEFSKSFEKSVVRDTAYNLLCQRFTCFCKDLIQMWQMENDEPTLWCNSRETKEQ